MSIILLTGQIHMTLNKPGSPKSSTDGESLDEAERQFNAILKMWL